MVSYNDVAWQQVVPTHHTLSFAEGKSKAKRPPLPTSQSQGSLAVSEGHGGKLPCSREEKAISYSDSSSSWSRIMREE
jgi:hypothetical protein